MSFEIERETSKLQGSKHMPELQAFRGLAALVVVIHHCTFYYNNSPLLHGLSQHIFNAHAAVVSFFVLSGFVLSKSLARTPVTLRSTVNFYVKRLFRIYPALFIAGMLGLAYLTIFHHHSLPAIVSTWWSHAQREKPISVSHIAIAFLGAGNALPVPVWSLFDEIIGSLFLPLIVIVISRGRLAAALLVLLLLAFSLRYGEHTWMSAGEYLVHFAIGACIPFFRGFFSFLCRTPVRTKFFALVALAILLFIRLLGGWNFEDFYHSPVPSNLEAIAAAILIGIIASSPTSFPFLRRRWSVWVGDISYSLYLLHMPIMGIVAGVGGEIFRIPLFTRDPAIASVTLLVVTLLFTLPLAALNYQFVEIPGIAIGKRFLKSSDTPISPLASTT